MKKDYLKPTIELEFFEGDVLANSGDDPYGEDKDWGDVL